MSQLSTPNAVDGCNISTAGDVHSPKESVGPEIEKFNSSGIIMAKSL